MTVPYFCAIRIQILRCNSNVLSLRDSTSKIWAHIRFILITSNTIYVVYSQEMWLFNSDLKFERDIEK